MSVAHFYGSATESIDGILTSFLAMDRAATNIADLVSVCVNEPAISDVNIAAWWKHETIASSPGLTWVDVSTHAVIATLPASGATKVTIRA